MKTKNRKGAILNPRFIAIRGVHKFCKNRQQSIQCGTDFRTRKNTLIAAITKREIKNRNLRHAEIQKCSQHRQKERPSYPKILPT